MDSPLNTADLRRTRSLRRAWWASVVVLAVTLVGLFSACGRPSGPADPELATFQASAVNEFKSFEKNLKQSLMAAMKSGGPSQAIAVCQGISPALAKSHSKDGLKVRRVSLKPRNPANAPDDFERRVLEEWQRKLTQGQAIGVVAERQSGTLRVMRPIRIPGGLCLQCHGAPEKLAPAVRQALQKTYPKDKALGYKVGDLRGAFTASKSVP